MSGRLDAEAGLNGYVEWHSASTGEVERAVLAQCSEQDGVVAIAFFGTTWWGSGRMALVAAPGPQRSTAVFLLREGVFRAQASICGELMRTANGIAYAGIWRDNGDKDASDFYLFIEASR